MRQNAAFSIWSKSSTLLKSSLYELKLLVKPKSLHSTLLNIHMII